MMNTREVIAGTGMLTDQTPALNFGPGDLEQVLRVVIFHPPAGLNT